MMTNEEVVIRFNQMLNDRDVGAMMSLMTADCVFENTDPPPDGERFEGQAAVRAFWEAFFGGSSACSIVAEELFSAGERVVMRWSYQWVDLSGGTGHIRGVDVYSMRQGLIAEKLSYVKG